MQNKQPKEKKGKPSPESHPLFGDSEEIIFNVSNENDDSVGIPVPSWLDEEEAADDLDGSAEIHFDDEPGQPKKSDAQLQAAIEEELNAEPEMAELEAIAAKHSPVASNIPPNPVKPAPGAALQKPPASQVAPKPLEQVILVEDFGDEDLLTPVSSPASVSANPVQPKPKPLAGNSSPEFADDDEGLDFVAFQEILQNLQMLESMEEPNPTLASTATGSGLKPNPSQTDPLSSTATVTLMEDGEEEDSDAESEDGYDSDDSQSELSEPDDASDEDENEYSSATESLIENLHKLAQIQAPSQKPAPATTGSGSKPNPAVTASSSPTGPGCDCVGRGWAAGREG